MKKPLLLLLLTFYLVPLNAQDSTPFKNSVRVNGFGLFTGYYEFQYERTLNSRSSVRVGFGTGTPINKTGTGADVDFETAIGTNIYHNDDNKRIVEGFTVNAEYRHFLENKAPAGLYAVLDYNTWILMSGTRGYRIKMN